MALSSSTSTRLLIALIASGIAQYLFLTMDLFLAGTPVFTAATNDDLSEVGTIRYAKDATSLVVIFYCIVRYSSLTSVCRQILSIFLCTEAGALLIGAFLVLDAPEFRLFVVSGARWNLTLFTAVCLFCIIGSTQHRRADTRLLLIFLFSAFALNDVVVLLQAMYVRDIMSLVPGAGAVRLSGIFSQAGVTGMFAVGGCLLLVCLRDVPKSTRIALFTLSALAASYAGSRQSLLLIFAMFSFSMYSGATGAMSFMRLFVALAFFASLPYVYDVVNSTVDRGDLIETQLEEGGRVFNFVMSLSDFSNSDVITFLIGSGTGKATNGMVTLFAQSDRLPDTYTFNYITDNTLITLLFQHGIIGIVAFLFAFWCLLLVSYRHAKIAGKTGEFLIVLAAVVITCFSANIFEQFFFMICSFSALGLLVSNGRTSKANKRSNNDFNYANVRPSENLNHEVTP